MWAYIKSQLFGLSLVILYVAAAIAAGGLVCVGVTNIITGIDGHHATFVHKGILQFLAGILLGIVLVSIYYGFEYQMKLKMGSW